MGCDFFAPKKGCKRIDHDENTKNGGYMNYPF